MFLKLIFNRIIRFNGFLIENNRNNFANKRKNRFKCSVKVTCNRSLYNSNCMIKHANGL